MKTSLASSARKSLPVEIAISVIKFKDVLASRAGRGTEYRMKLRSKNPRVVLKGDDIYVARPGATLRFTLVPAAGDKTSYIPLGIAYVREGVRSSSDAQRLGLLSFPQAGVSLAGRSITVTDVYADGKERVRYKFSVIIQRGSDGKIGIIDPGVIHEDDHFTEE